MVRVAPSLGVKTRRSAARGCPAASSNSEGGVTKIPSWGESFWLALHESLRLGGREPGPTGDLGHGPRWMPIHPFAITIATRGLVLSRNGDALRARVSQPTSETALTDDLRPASCTRTGIRESIDFREGRAASSDRANLYAGSHRSAPSVLHQGPLVGSTRLLTGGSTMGAQHRAESAEDCNVSEFDTSFARRITPASRPGKRALEHSRLSTRVTLPIAMRALRLPRVWKVWIWEDDVDGTRVNWALDRAHGTRALRNAGAHRGRASMST